MPRQNSLSSGANEEGRIFLQDMDDLLWDLRLRLRYTSYRLGPFTYLVSVAAWHG